MNLTSLKGGFIDWFMGIRTFVSQSVVLLLAGMAVGGWLAWKIQDARVARAELQMMTLKADIATGASTVIAANSDSERNNLKAIMASMNSIGVRLDDIPARLRAEIDKTNTELRRLTNGANYACLYIPYPDDGLHELEQADGSAATGAYPY